MSQTVYSVVIFSQRFIDSDCINFKTFAFLAVYWPFWTSLYKTDNKVQQFSKSILRVVTSHLNFGSSLVIWSHFRVESSQSSHVQISMGTSHGILLETFVIESDSSHIPGHYQRLEQYSVTRSHWTLYITRLTRLDSNPQMRPNYLTRPKI